VSSLDLALSLVAQNPAWRFVTPRGELVDAAGVLGGYRELTQGAVGRRSEAGELERRIEVLRQRIDEKRRELEAKAARLAQWGTQLVALQEERDEARQAMTQAQSGAQAEAARAADLEKSVQRLAEDRGRLVQEKEALAAELAGAHRLTESAEADFEQANRRHSELDQARIELEAARETVQRELNQLQVTKTRAHSELESLKERIAAEQKRVEIDSAEIDRAEGRSQNFLANAEQGKGQGEHLAVEAEALRDQRAAMEETLQRLRAEERTHAEQAQVVRTQAEAVQKSLDQVSDGLNKGQLRQQRLDLAREDVVARASDSWPSTNTRCAATSSPTRNC